MTREEFGIKLGQTLRTYRDAAGLSLADVANKIGTSRAAIHDYEHGRKEPSAWVLSRLCPALGMDRERIGDILGG